MILDVFSSVDTIWMLLGAALVFLMQAGFCMVEAGFTRAKNSGNIIMKNLMDFAIGAVLFWVIGYSLMFGDDVCGIIGIPSLFGKGISAGPETIPDEAFLIFQTVFCATAATIVSGAMAERTKFSSYLMYTIVISVVIYPVTGHWIWGGGWLADLGFIDLAGSTAVHMVGGVCAFIGAKFLGARIGKYSKDGTAKAIPGHSLTLGALGVFILWFCWFGFNGCSTFTASGDDVIGSMAHIFVTTNIAACVATIAVMIISWVKYGKPDVSMTLNGSLAGLVAITAGCHVVSPLGSAAIGLIAGFVVFFGIEFVDKKLKVDDPVGAVGVHGCCGAIGTILIGFFALDGGLLYGDGFKLLGIQLAGVFSVMAYVAAVICVTFYLIKKYHGLRVSTEEEIVGLDIMEHGLTSSYADFMPITATPSEDVVKSVDVPKAKYADPDSDSSIKKVVIVTKTDRFDRLQTAMTKLGIKGMTVTNCAGYGVQQGNAAAYYRGTKVDVKLLPQIKVEFIVKEESVLDLVQTIKESVFTGNAGDGKIFITDIENVVRVRTGEEGILALDKE